MQIANRLLGVAQFIGNSVKFLVFDVTLEEYLSADRVIKPVDFFDYPVPQKKQLFNAFCNLTEAIWNNSSLFTVWNTMRAFQTRRCTEFLPLCAGAPQDGISLQRDKFYALQRLLSGCYFSRLEPFCQI